jgi:biotin operon repressor
LRDQWPPARYVPVAGIGKETKHVSPSTNRGLKEPHIMDLTTTQTPTGERLVALLARWGGETTESNASIARELDCSITAVKKAIRRAEDGGRIVVDRRRRNNFAGDPAGRTLRIAPVSK